MMVKKRGLKDEKEREEIRKESGGRRESCCTSSRGGWMLDFLDGIADHADSLTHTGWRASVDVFHTGQVRYCSWGIAMSRTKEHCARVAVDHSTHFLYDSNSTQHVITLPATKSNLTYSLSSSLHHIFSMQRCVQANNRAGPSGMFTIARHHLSKRRSGNAATGFLTGYVGVERCASGTCHRRGRQDEPPCDCTWPWHTVTRREMKPHKR